ncbi:MAG: hypothetical protein HXY50_13905 [Ignavibacteriaceae bacterium]|nr:hypothetical protein [Ignavibacteriaceae bacterium]
MGYLEKIQERFENNGYKKVSNYRLPSDLLWQPDLVFTKNSFTYLVLAKTNNTIPPSYLIRISNIPNKKIIPLIIFAQKLKNQRDEQFILSLGISIGYLIKGRLVDIHIRKKLPEKSIKREIGNKLQSIDIFISSKQDIDEREFVKRRINVLRDTHNYPFFTHLIEYDKFNLKKLRQHIDEEMNRCEWIVIVLEDNHSKDVSYEIKKAIKTIEHENIFMFVKSTNRCHNTWKKELNKIKNLENKSIHYFPYFNLDDLEVTLSKAINKRMGEICKKKKIKLFS